MLTKFEVSRTYELTRMTLWIDCVLKEADLTVVFHEWVADKTIVELHYADVDTPSKAEAWLSSRIEGAHQTLCGVVGQVLLSPEYKALSQ